MAPGSGMSVPLTAILGKPVVDVDFESADYGAWIRRRTHHALVENRGGVDLTAGPSFRLPGPPVAGGARISDNAISGSPLAHIDTAVDAGALNSQHRIDSAKPLKCQIVPGVVVYILVDAEEDRGTLTATRRGMQLPGGASIGDAALEPAPEVRWCCPAWLAVLVVADDHQPGSGQLLGVRPGDR